MAEVGVLLDRDTAALRWKYGLNVFEAYIAEILSHAGIPFRSFDQVKQVAESSIDILIVALEADDHETASVIWEFAESGGVVISYAGLARLASKLGSIESKSEMTGYADVSNMMSDVGSLRFLQAKPWGIDASAENDLIREIGKLAKEHPTGVQLCPAMLAFPIGKGSIERWAVNIPETVVKIQQGEFPVLKDGIPAPDGTGAVNEGILKADDGVVLDWQLDRQVSETGNPYYSKPCADLWREVLISHLLQTAVSRGLTLPFLGYWPDGISHVAMISHDSDLNEDQSAETTLETLKQADIQSTWCMMEPGYSPYIYERVKEEGHELAFHYNALPLDHGIWEEAEFVRQLRWLKDATGMQKITSNKNHYTRYEGWGELFEWCESHGISSDQTRGASKKGNAGFLFGTCQPYFPIAWWNQQNRLYDVVEIGFLTQDLDIGVWADSSVIIPFLEQVERVEGVAHFLFHQVHLHYKDTARAALISVAQIAKQRGFTFWTGKKINDWVRARRNVQIQGIEASGRIVIDNSSVSDPLVVWVPMAQVEEKALTEQTEMRYGIPCKKVIL